MFKRCISIICITSSFLILGQDVYSKETHFDDGIEFLAHQLPADLAGKPIVHLRTLAIQKDAFSCGYHAVFNAVALDKAIQGGYYDFDRKLRNCLSDRDLFFRVCSCIKEKIKENRPLNGQDIMDAASAFSLDTRLLPLFFTDKEHIMVPSLQVTVFHPPTLKKEEIQKLLYEKQREESHIRITQMLAAIKNKPYQAAHFICNIGNHWITCSMITNRENQPKLYIIGAWNEPMNEAMKKYAHQLLGLWDKVP